MKSALTPTQIESNHIIMSRPVTLSSVSELKNATDDQVREHFQSQGFIESKFYSNVRLALGYTALTFAGITTYYDYKVGFLKAKWWTWLGTSLYFLFSLAMSLWEWAIEGNYIYIGHRDGTTLRVSSRAFKFTSIYEIDYETVERSGSFRVEGKSDFSAWIDERGFIVTERLRAWLSKIAVQTDKKKA